MYCYQRCACMLYAVVLMLVVCCRNACLLRIHRMPEESVVVMALPSHVIQFWLLNKQNQPHAPVQASCALCYLVCRAVELSILLWHAGIPDGCYAMSAALQKVPKAQAASGPPLPHLQQVSFHVAACCAHAQAQNTRVRSHM